MAAPKGNKFAAKAKIWELALKHEIAKDRERLYRIADKVLLSAEAGESWAVTEVRNTLDGKPKEHVHVEHTDNRLSYGERVKEAAAHRPTVVTDDAVGHTVQ